MVRFLTGARVSSLFHFQTCRDSPKSSYPVGTESVSLRIKHWGLNVASHIHLVLRLTMSAVIPPLQFMTSSCAKKHKFTLYNSQKRTITQQTGTVKKSRILFWSYFFQISAELQYILTGILSILLFCHCMYIYIYI